MSTHPATFLPKARFDELLQLLDTAGYETLGPALGSEAIVYAPIRSHRDLPIGWTDEQTPGGYRLRRRDDEAWFGFAVGPHSWKAYLFPPRLRLWQARRGTDGFSVEAPAPAPKKRAFLGVRSCELHAIAIQDRTFFRDGQVWDPHYAAARSQALVLAVECEHPAATCFCVSMDTGPAVDPRRLPLPQSVPPGAPTTLVDLVLTELADGFVVRSESDAGAALVEALSLALATPAAVADGQARITAAAGRMGRQVEAAGLRDLLQANLEHPRWDVVAERCLACTNCTMVCPTCFCMSAEEVMDLSLEVSGRERVWDSCFNPEFAAVHGGNARPSIRGRYRQWLTHKFSSWLDQFEVSGCVGCGRCITWCPVGIDVTEELAAIRGGTGPKPTPTA
ncbi:MAG TPA: 4Fe-4S dicluster domain-containing protein [Gemmatales bacterium]|nr:4Fe-4S dicluster domain-containing protein [Gemmatales bacterium]